METAQQVEQVLFDSIDEINTQLPQAQQVEKALDTPLFGRDGVLDSLALVNLIVAVEQKLQERLNVAVTLADEKAMSQKNSPFKTVASLAGYIVQLISEETNN